MQDRLSRSGCMGCDLGLLPVRETLMVTTFGLRTKGCVCVCTPLLELRHKVTFSDNTLKEQRCVRNTQCGLYVAPQFLMGAWRVGLASFCLGRPVWFTRVPGSCL